MDHLPETPAGSPAICAAQAHISGFHPEGRLHPGIPERGLRRKHGSGDCAQLPLAVPVCIGPDADPLRARRALLPVRARLAAVVWPGGVAAGFVLPRRARPEGLRLKLPRLAASRPGAGPLNSRPSPCLGRRTTIRWAIPGSRPPCRWPCCSACSRGGICGPGWQNYPRPFQRSTLRCSPGKQARVVARIEPREIFPLLSH